MQSFYHIIHNHKMKVGYQSSHIRKTHQYLKLNQPYEHINECSYKWSFPSIRVLNWYSVQVLEYQNCNTLPSLLLLHEYSTDNEANMWSSTRQGRNVQVGPNFIKLSNIFTKIQKFLLEILGHFLPWPTCSLELVRMYVTESVSVWLLVWAPPELPRWCPCQDP